jgi:hypothetical protein
MVKKAHIPARIRTLVVRLKFEFDMHEMAGQQVAN